MIQELKALFVVLTLGSMAFFLGRRIWLTAMSVADFERRRNTWYVLTIVAFLSPSFWIFFLLAIPLLLWAGQRDSNPLALYVLLFHVIPPVHINIPMVGINYLIDINAYRLLALTVLLPFAWHLLSRKDESTNRGSRKFALSLVVIFSLFQVAQLMQDDAITNTLRRVLLALLDSILLVYVFSRGVRSMNQIREILACFVLMLAVMAPIAVFESARGWLLYQNMAAKWDVPLTLAYLMRGDMLRAQVSTGHALAFGYLLAVAFGAWLYLSKHKEISSRDLWIGGVWIWAGLIAAYSRAPWLTAVLMLILFTALAPGRRGRMIKLMLGGGIASAAVLMSPLGERVIAVLPFVGTVDAENVTYRQRLAEASWEVILQHPFFGTPYALNYLEHMRQGEGIIDLVNVYAAIAMFHGLFGFTLFAGYFLLAVVVAFKASRRDRTHRAEAASLGACLVTLLLGTYFFMATGSFGTALAQMAWILSALAIGYAGLRERTNPNGPA